MVQAVGLGVSVWECTASYPVTMVISIAAADVTSGSLSAALVSLVFLNSG